MSNRRAPRAAGISRWICVVRAVSIANLREEGATWRDSALWSVRDFRAFWIGQTASNLGDAFGLPGQWIGATFSGVVVGRQSTALDARVRSRSIVGVALATLCVLATRSALVR